MPSENILPKGLPPCSPAADGAAAAAAAGSRSCAPCQPGWPCRGPAAAAPAARPRCAAYCVVRDCVGGSGRRHSHPWTPAKALECRGLLPLRRRRVQGRLPSKGLQLGICPYSSAPAASARRPVPFHLLHQNLCTPFLVLTRRHMFRGNFLVRLSWAGAASGYLPQRVAYRSRGHSAAPAGQRSTCVDR